MKKLITITTALIIGTSIVSAQSVTSGIFGVAKVTIPPAGGMNLVGYNFTSSETIYLEDVFGTGQLVQNTRSTRADKIFIWDGTKYTSYFQKTDGLFYSTAASTVPVDVEILEGTAMFLQSPSGSSQENEIIFSGSVAMDVAISQTYSSAGYELFSNPYSSAYDLNGASSTWENATGNTRQTRADRVYIWNSVDVKFDLFYLDANKVWQAGTGVTTQPIIPMGVGCFYSAQNDLINDIQRPY